MFESWMKREWEYQQFIDKITLLSYQKENEINDAAYHLGVALVITEYLKRRQQGEKDPEILLLEEENHYKVFFKEVLSKINRFNQSEAEKDLLLVQFLEKMIGAGVIQFRGRLLKQEVMGQN